MPNKTLKQEIDFWETEILKAPLPFINSVFVACCLEIRVLLNLTKPQWTPTRPEREKNCV